MYHCISVLQGQNVVLVNTSNNSMSHFHIKFFMMVATSSDVLFQVSDPPPIVAIKAIIQTSDH